MVYLYVLQGVKTNKEIYLLLIQEYLFHINTISYLIQVFFQGEILFLQAQELPEEYLFLFRTIFPI